MSANTGEDRNHPVSLNQVLREVIALAAGEIEHRLELSVEYGELPTIRGDGGELARAFSQLLAFAVRAVGGGDLEQSWIRVRTWCRHDQVFTEIRGTGAGIAERDLPRLFDRSFTPPERVAGEAPDLALSNEIIIAHGGEIEAQSKPGVGTRFVVRLPVSVAPSAPGPDPSRASSGRRVLVIDDERRICEIIRRMLAPEHEAVIVTSGTAAMEILARDQAFDAIICDLMMPDVTGVEVHEWLAQRFGELADRVLFITGGAFCPEMDASLGRLHNPRLQKPLEAQILRRRVAEVVAANSARPE